MEDRNVNAISALLSDFSTRVNDLEERIKLMRDRIVILDQTLLKQNERVLKEIKNVKEDISDLKNKLEKVEEATEHIVSESDEFARKEELLVFDKFLKMWEPMNFATIDDVKEMINEAMRGRKSRDSKEKIIPVEEN